VSWYQDAAAPGFGPENLPYCAFTSAGGAGVAVRIGDHLLNLGAAEEAGLVAEAGAFAREHLLDRFLALGRPEWRRVRERITDLVTGGRDRVAPVLLPVADAELRLPFTVADYVDFYSSEHHAMNMSRILRPGQASLQPNWRHLPVGYHGRAGTVVVSGADVVRPWGQSRPDADSPPRYGPSARLDVEAEVGFVVGLGSRTGQAVGTGDFRDHVFGAVLVNDWSARDLQAWEYQPLGPFLAKSFATSISAYVVPLDALEPARVPAPDQEPPVLGHLVEADRYAYDLRLAVRWNGTVVSRPPFRTMYWTPAQQLAHLTSNGARLRTGDLYASGTVSGPTRAEVGSFMELCWGGTEPVTLGDGSSRTFLEDGDTVTISGTATGPAGTVVAMGDVTGRIVSEWRSQSAK
jgi:fumarylacetoacetase